MSAPAKTKFKAGIVLYRAMDGAPPQFLLVSARKYAGSWVFPVGTVKKGEALEEAARRECVEESGYIAEILAPLPELVVTKRNVEVRYSFFLATVSGNATDWEKDRQQRWVAASDLSATVTDIFRPVAEAAIGCIPDPGQHAEDPSGEEK